jgi:hypothetical protein
MPRLPLVLAASSLVLALSVSVHAPPARASKESAGTKAATIDLMRAIMPPAAYDAMLDQFQRGVAASMAQMGAGAFPADKQQALNAAVKECLPYEELLSWTGDVYSKHFTEKEVADLAAFYKTPTGKKLAGLLPQLTGEIGAKVSPIIMTRLPPALKKHGIK